MISLPVPVREDGSVQWAHYRTKRDVIPSEIVIHYTAGGTYENVITWMSRDNERRVSAHFVVAEDGRYAMICPLDYTAWHAGVWSRNVSSIGIELVHPDDDSPYPEPQINALVELCRKLFDFFGISKIVGHRDIVPTVCPRALDLDMVRARVEGRMKRYIYGMHERPPQDFLDRWADMLSDGIPGIIVHTEELGSDPDNRSGKTYRDGPFETIARLNNGYNPNGTLPEYAKYGNFVTRVANFVANSEGCHIWILGNETNHPQEWPHGQKIYPQHYAECYVSAHRAIHGIPGHENDLLLVAGPAPWAAEVKYQSNPSGDWVEYLEDIIFGIEDADITPDGFALHTYTHGTDPGLLTSTKRMDPPFEHRYFEFHALFDFMDAIKRLGYDVPVYVTETNPGASKDMWPAGETRWVSEMYKLASKYNVKGVALFRWPKHDPTWYIEGRAGTIEDFWRAVDLDIQTEWDDLEDDPEEKPVETIFDGFEDGFYPYENVGELTCPNGWKPTWVQGTEEQTKEGFLVRPEYNPAGQDQVRTGQGAAAIRSRNATIDGALYRQFDVAPGSVTAAVWMLKTEPAMGHGMQIGIDPLGGTDHASLEVVWSDWYSEHEADYELHAWRRRSVSTVSGGKITVFLRSALDLRADGSNAHFDDFSLTVSEKPPMSGDGLLQYLDRMRQLLDEMEQFIEEGKISCLPL